MNRIAALAVASTLTAGLAAPAALAAKKPAHPARWDAVAGQFATRSAASKEMKTLHREGLKGYDIDTERRGAKFEVSKRFSSEKKAKAAVTQLRAKGTKGAFVEAERGEKTVR